MIEVRNLVKKYGNHLAVDHLNFTVEKGKIYGFLGPNGAGKSTTMNMLTGYIASTEGDILIDGHNILDEPEEAKKRIGYLPELPPLYQDMTVLEYLRFAAELKSLPKEKRENYIREVMSTTKVENVKHRLIKNLSKGYKQRVGLAQALLGYPEVIILDEPTVGLDPKQIIEIRDLIKSLGEKHTVILSSHILSEVSAVCDYVLIIDRGKLVASDSPENLSRVMSGANSLEITVKGTEEEIRKALDMVENLEEVIYHQSLVPGACDFTIKIQGEQDMRENIFFALAEVKCPLLKMQSTNMTLEEVFLKLTDDRKSNSNKPLFEDDYGLEEYEEDGLERTDLQESAEMENMQQDPEETYSNNPEATEFREDSSLDVSVEENKKEGEEYTMLAIYKKELRSYLTSMAGYVFIAFILLILGIYFTAYNLQYASPDFGITLNAVTFLFLIITPVLTMRILSEEKKNKTDQLLFTAPVAVWKIVLGKYLSMVTIYLIPVVIVSFYPTIMAQYGTVSYAMAYTAVVGFFFLGCAQIAVGLFLSSVTESQVIAAVLTFGVLFCSYVMDGIESFFSDTAMSSFLTFLVISIVVALVVYQMTKDAILSGILGIILIVANVILYLVKSSFYEGLVQKFLDLLAIANHFDNFVGGILDVTGIVYMLSVICIFVFLTVQCIQKRRWS